jgi:hypothetical protein
MAGDHASRDRHLFGPGPKRLLSLDGGGVRGVITGLGIVAKRVDTASLWIVANNPRAPYWDTPREGNFIGNRHYKLTNLLRASTAAPIYFEPESIPILEKVEGLFIDGGVSPHNNPALALFMMARLKAYGLCWDTGSDKLTIVSAGTGPPVAGSRVARADAECHDRVACAAHRDGRLARPCPGADAMVRSESEAMLVNSEIQDLPHDLFPAGPLFRFLRYDVRLEADWLEQQLGIRLSEKELARVREMDNPESIPLAYDIGQRAAERQVKKEHWIAPYADDPSPPL